MSDRKKILELFEDQKDFMQEKINYGIENNRKGYADICITSKDGTPVENAEISVKQKSHEFKFGANLFMLDELETKEKNEIYRQRFAELFNMATLPFYWDATEPEKGHTRYKKDSERIYRRPAIDLCMEFCEKNGIEPREHALAYEHFFPQWLKNASVTEVKLAYENRCREIAELYKDKIHTIEVTNEMFWHDSITPFYNEPDFVEWCFKTAEKYFPANELTINEASAESWSCPANACSTYYAYIQSNMLKGARIDAIGMQFHMFYPREVEYESTKYAYNPKNLYKHMDLYAQLGKPLQLTEVTIPAYSSSAEDEELQAELLKNLYSIWFSHANVEQIIYWNLVDGYAYQAEPGDMTAGENYYYGGLINFDMTPKPSYYMLKDLICNQWNTHESIVTGKNGKASFKGFYGAYDVSIKVGNETITKEIFLRKGGKNDFSIEI